jgi:hypothetical protein
MKTWLCKAMGNFLSTLQMKMIKKELTSTMVQHFSSMATNFEMLTTRRNYYPTQFKCRPFTANNNQLLHKAVKVSLLYVVRPLIETMAQIKTFPSFGKTF